MLCQFSAVSDFSDKRVHRCVCVAINHPPPPPRKYTNLYRPGAHTPQGRRCHVQHNVEELRWWTAQVARWRRRRPNAKLVGADIEVAKIASSRTCTRYEWSKSHPLLAHCKVVLYSIINCKITSSLIRIRLRNWHPILQAMMLAECQLPHENAFVKVVKRFGC